MTRVSGEGGCHCGNVRFSFDAPESVQVFICNCSICHMKQNHHFIIPQTDMKLLTPEENLSEYRSGLKLARHLFCKTCGVQAFYQPRSNPDGWAVTIYCVRDYQNLFKNIEWIKFDGQDWEGSFAKSDIASHSKKQL